MGIGMVFAPSGRQTGMVSAHREGADYGSGKEQNK